MNSDLIAKRKARARKIAKSRREDMQADPSHLIRSWPAAQASAIIAGFWPLGTEIDTRPLLHRLSENHRIVLPVTPRDRMRLSFREWTPGCEMETGPMKTRHPVGTMASGTDPLVPHIVLVPMLAFTSKGERLGYGGGYYDMTLAALKANNPSVRAIGVAYAAQQVATLPTTDMDVPLDGVLTEEGFRLFRP